MFRNRTFATQASLWGLTALMMFSLSAVCVTAVVAPSTAIAQDEDVVPADPAPASDGEPAPKRQSYLGWMFKALGIRYTVVFLGLSFTMVALFVMNLLTARRDNICPAHLEETFADQPPGENEPALRV